MNLDQVQVGWLVETTNGPMFWPIGEHATAVTYCEDDAEPVAIYCNKPELERHNAAQESKSHGN